MREADMRTRLRTVIHFWQNRLITPRFKFDIAFAVERELADIAAARDFHLHPRAEAEVTADGVCNVYIVSRCDVVQLRMCGFDMVPFRLDGQVRVETKDDDLRVVGWAMFREVPCG